MFVSSQHEVASFALNCCNHPSFPVVIALLFDPSTKVHSMLCNFESQMYKLMAQTSKVPMSLPSLPTGKGSDLPRGKMPSTALTLLLIVPVVCRLEKALQMPQHGLRIPSHCGLFQLLWLTSRTGDPSAPRVLQKAACSVLEHREQPGTGCGTCNRGWSDALIRSVLPASTDQHQQIGINRLANECCSGPHQEHCSSRSWHI